MKKVMQIVAVMIVMMSPLALNNNALAAGTCQVGYTGPNSNNVCVSTTTYNCSVVNSTTVSVNGVNQQFALSGDALGTSAVTGSATNSNGVTFNVAVENQICAVTATVPATVVTPPARPAASTPAVVAPQKVTAAALPNTDSASPLAVAGIAVGALGAGAVLVRLVASAYVRIKS